MNEAEWLAGTNLSPMLDCLWSVGKHSERKSRLFAVACCRRAWHLFRADHARTAVEVAELYADGEATEDQLSAARRATEGPAKLISDYWLVSSACGDADAPCAAQAARAVAAPAAFAAGPTAEAAAKALAFALAKAAPPRRRHGLCEEMRKGEARAQCGLLREIFGNPFRPVAFEVAWRTPQVVQLAGSAYEVRQLPGGGLDNAHLAILGDALEEAGCTEQSVLEHLRGPGPHVRGCWAVDTVLGRS